MPSAQIRFRQLGPAFLMAAGAGALALSATGCGEADTPNSVSAPATANSTAETSPSPVSTSPSAASPVTPGDANAEAAQPVMTSEEVSSTQAGNQASMSTPPVAPQSGPNPSGDLTPSEPDAPAVDPNDSMPGDSMPGDSMPGDSMPGDSMPGDSMPGDSMPGDSMPGDSMPGDSMPGDSMPGDSMPGDSMPGDSMPGDGNDPASLDASSEPMPSPGCDGGNPNAMVPNSAVDVPDGYDGSTPSPVFFAFHGAGGDTSSLQGPFASDAKARGFLGVYLKSSGSGWDVRADTPRLDDAYDAVLQNYCVDVNRVFAIGHSSGAQMITQLLCAGDSRFRAVAPVASSKYCNGWDPVSVIAIHGVDDIERGGQGEMRYGLNDGDGHIDFGVYHDSNQCSDASTEFDPGGNCAASIHPGCVEYNDCAVRTVFCNHDDPQYGTSNHGVPCFASKVVFDFFEEHK